MPDFGSFRGFGEKLAQGQTPTQLGKIGSETFGFDVDASAFFTRVTNAGGTLSNTEQYAINQLVIDLKAYGIWTAMKAVYPMVGASAAACAQNLKSSSFTGTFTSGWTFASTGVTPNGTSAYMDTGLNISTNLSLTDTHLSYYSRTNVENSSYGAEIGILGSYSATNYMILRTRNSTSPTTAYFTIGEDNGAGISSTNGTGLTTGSATSLTSRKIYKNSSLAATQTTSNTGNLPNLNAAIGMNVIGSYSSNESSFASIGLSLTDTQASNLYTAVQAFQTSLSRQV